MKNQKHFDFIDPSVISELIYILTNIESVGYTLYILRHKKCGKIYLTHHQGLAHKVQNFEHSRKKLCKSLVKLNKRFDANKILTSGPQPAPLVGRPFSNKVKEISDQPQPKRNIEKGKSAEQIKKLRWRKSHRNLERG